MDEREMNILEKVVKKLDDVKPREIKYELGQPTIENGPYKYRYEVPYKDYIIRFEGRHKTPPELFKVEVLNKKNDVVLHCCCTGSGDNRYSLLKKQLIESYAKIHKAFDKYNKAEAKRKKDNELKKLEDSL